jgi:hypothetical protein
VRTRRKQRAYAVKAGQQQQPSANTPINVSFFIDAVMLHHIGVYDGVIRIALQQDPCRFAGEERLVEFQLADSTGWWPPRFPLVGAGMSICIVQLCAPCFKSPVLYTPLLFTQSTRAFTPSDSYRFAFQTPSASGIIPHDRKKKKRKYDFPFYPAFARENAIIAASFFKETIQSSKRNSRPAPNWRRVGYMVGCVNAACATLILQTSASFLKMSVLS